MGKGTFLNDQDITNNITALFDSINQSGLEGFYISSFDPYLNEYTPLEACHRYYFTGFSGSVAEVLALNSGKIKLYVDGRYHEQADKEIKDQRVEVVKVPIGESLSANLLKDLQEAKISKLGCEFQRTSLSMFKEFENLCDEVVNCEKHLAQKVNFKSSTVTRPINFLKQIDRGPDTSVKLKRIFAEETHASAYFLSSLEDIAWVSNCRGYHLPFQSAFLARALVTKEKVFIFTDSGTPVSEEALKQNELEFIEVNGDQLENKLTQLQNDLNLERVYFDGSALNKADFNAIQSAFGDILQPKAQGLVPFHSIKTPEELEIIEDSFNRSNKAIYDTISWARQKIQGKETYSELELSNKLSENYKSQGAKELSFNTISAIGANGSIIHYSNASDDVKARLQDLVLLDSGAYYEPGFATDTTRTFLASSDSGQASEQQKEMYTLV
ncbi:MAG: M24 family metallopeptidase, partial [bacterium]